MNKVLKRRGGLILVLMTVLLLLGGIPAQAVIIGELGPTFDLAAKQGHIKAPDGDSILMWGYTLGARMQYPGPTMIVNQGDEVTVTLTNDLPPEHRQNVSIVFPGHVVSATGGVEGVLTREAGYAGNPDLNPTTVTYTFVATNPGTYLYRSGTRPDLQVEMGLVGGLIVRPAATVPQEAQETREFSPPLELAYNHLGTAYHYEYLYLVTEVDINIHRLVEFGRIDEVDTTTRFAVHWFVNGRAFPDILQPPGVPWFKTQPYNILPRTHPFEKVLIRFIQAGWQLHPMHYHGADFSVIAVDGRLLSSDPDGGPAGPGPDLAWQASTINFTPGQTGDFLWEWTGANLGWDVYGHPPGAIQPPSPDYLAMGYESLAGHGEPFPVILAQRDDLAFGQFYSGSPFLGGLGDLPPDAPGLNSSGGYLFPWHSHSEKELTSNDVFPGGLLTFVILEPPNVCILPNGTLQCPYPD